MSDPARQLSHIKEITVYVEDENGVKRANTYPAARCVLGGIKDGTPIARVLDEDGDLVDFLNVSMKIKQGPPSGLVAPPSGGVIVPPTS